jgi:hypothetical protein
VVYVLIDTDRQGGEGGEEEKLKRGWTAEARKLGESRSKQKGKPHDGPVECELIDALRSKSKEMMSEEPRQAAKCSRLFPLPFASSMASDRFSAESRRVRTRPTSVPTTAFRRVFIRRARRAK